MSTSKNSKESPKKSSKVKPSAIGSFSKLDVRIICPNPNPILGGWKYAMGNYIILFLSVDYEQVMELMKKYIRVVETIINYDSDDNAYTCESRAVMYSSNICFASLKYSKDV